MAKPQKTSVNLLMPKKPDVNECELYWTMNLMNHKLA